MPKTSTLLVICVLLLVAIGIVMVASASSVLAVKHFDGDQLGYVKRQGIWLFIGLVGAWICYKRDYKELEKYALAIGVITILILIAVLIPHVGTKVNGSRRWLRMGPLSFQPSELAKIGTLICLSAWMAFVQKEAGTFKKGFLFPMGGLGFTALLVLAEPDFGTTVLIGLSGMAVMFAGGAHCGWLFGSAFAGAGVLGTLILHDDVRRERMLAFWNPAEHPAAAFHLIQSKLAFIRGHWFGVGLGDSLQKHQYLPEAHTDFILPIIGEELGFVGAMCVLLLFTVILGCGMRIAWKANERFGKLLAFGITMLITTQAAINIAVVTGAMPTTGLPLPFISYGGSSMMISLACIGILLNIARHVPDEEAASAKAIKNKARRL